MYSTINPVIPQAQDNLNRPIGIDYSQDKIHNGEMFRINAKFSLNTAGTKKFLFRTGAKEAHIYGEISSSGSAYFDVYESPTTTADGAPVSILNKKRSSSNTPVATAFDTPTVTANGTLLDPFQMWVGEKAGGGDRNQHEWAFKANTDYLFIATSTTDANNFVTKVEFYEV